VRQIDGLYARFRAGPKLSPSLRVHGAPKMQVLNEGHARGHVHVPEKCKGAREGRAGAGSGLVFSNILP
jgi:hypothetical protein